MHYKGREIRHEELLELMSKDNNAQKLKWIREKLDEIYRKEFTKKRVAEQVKGISYQTLYFLEERGKEPRMDTIRKLAQHYNVPLEIFEKDKPLQPFFLGRKEDEQRWIEEQNEAFMNGRDISEFDYDIEDNDELPDYIEPEYASDEFSIEVDMKIFMGTDSNPTMTYLVQERTAIDEEDIEDIRKQISQLIRLLGRKYLHIKTKEAAIKELQRKKSTPEEALASIQSYIASGKLADDQARFKERMSTRLRRSVQSKNTKSAVTKDMDEDDGAH